MAMAASGGQRAAVFKLCGRQLITLYLSGAAASGKLSNALLPGGCSVTADVDVFAASPDKLPFVASHTGHHGEVWGYFPTAHMADTIQPAPGGCWVVHGEEKRYAIKDETFGYRRRFAFHVTRVEGDGTVMWAPTRWMMKEYRLNKDADMVRKKMLGCPEANIDFVIRKVFTKPAVTLPPPARSGGEALQGVGVPVNATALAVRKDPTKTKTKGKTKTKKVVPLPCASSEGGVALQQGGTSLPPRSARPPLPPKVVRKPVVPPPPAHFIETPVGPRPPAHVIATSVASPLPTQVIAKPVAPPPPPKVIATSVAPLPQPQAIATPVAPSPPAQVIATPVASPPQPVRSSQDEAALSRVQPDKPNANMELVVSTVPAKPLTRPPAPRPPPGLTAQTVKVPSGRWIIGAYLGPKAFGNRQHSSVVNPCCVAEGVDVFAVSPNALSSPPMYRKQNGEVLGYFFSAKPTNSMQLARGGCWMQYGREKKYCIDKGEVLAFHRRFAFRAVRMDGDGMLAWVQTPTRWLMKEYRMNKASPTARAKQGPGANMDLVVLKVFTKPVIPPPPPPPAPASFSESENLLSNYP